MGGEKSDSILQVWVLCWCMGSELDSEDRDREITDRVAADQGGEDRIAKLEARIDELEERD